MHTDGFKFEEYTREDLRIIAPKALVIIPVGAIEQHGPHLPVGTDSIKVDYYVAQAAQRLQRYDLLVAPTIWYGHSDHHLDFPGTMSLRGDTLLAVLCDLGDSLVKGGFRRIFILSGHGGNKPIITRAVQELVLRHDDLVVGAATAWQIAHEAMQRELMKYGTHSPTSHAGISETAMMLDLRENLVDKDALDSLKRKDFSEHKIIRHSSLQKQAFVMRSKRMKATNGLGESPVNATQELGEKLSKVVIEELVKFFNNLLSHP